MLKRIVDTSRIDIEDPEIARELGIDLNRMNHMTHNSPDNTNAYRIIVSPSSQTYSPGLHRFTFNIQYGRLDGEVFKAIGQSIERQSETLPMI
jgi:hypothetical protein